MKKIFQGSSKSGKDSLRILALGGAGNVTKNMFVYEYRWEGKLRDVLIVDCGVGFPEAEMYGVDLIIPDVRYLSDKRDKIRGLVFTHGHDDHIGGISYLYPRLGRVPMWATTLTAAFANIKLKEAKINARVKSVEFASPFRVGPFRITPLRVTHSVPDTAHLVIETPVGIVYHGTDFKFDFDPLDGKHSQLAEITAVGRQEILCLLTDCLGSERPGFTPSEQIVGETIEKELRLCQGKFIFTTQSSNVSRIQKAVEIAVRHGRKVAFLGRSIGKNVEEAVKLGYMKFSRESVIYDRDLRREPVQKQFLIVAGSQGQQESALSRIANDDHNFVHLTEKDTVVISADPIPGRENDVNTLIDQIYRHGCRVSYSDIMEDLHVSGHGSQGDLMLLLSALGPRYIIPIGGTSKHLVQYRHLAEDLGYSQNNVLIPQEGEIIEFQDGRPKVVGQIELENVMVDGLMIGDVGSVVLRDRQTIATEGIVVVVVPLVAAGTRVAASPEIISRGFIYVKESGTLLNQAREVVRRAVAVKHGRQVAWPFVRKKIEETLGAFFFAKTGRRPLIVPVVIET